MSKQHHTPTPFKKTTNTSRPAVHLECIIIFTMYKVSEVIRRSRLSKNEKGKTCEEKKSHHGRRGVEEAAWLCLEVSASCGHTRFLRQRTGVRGGEKGQRGMSESTTGIRSHSTQGRRGKVIYLRLSLILFPLAEIGLTTPNWIWYRFFVSPHSVSPGFLSVSCNKSCCNYQAGSITVTSLLFSARLKLTLTCSSLAACHSYGSVSDRSNSFSTVNRWENETNTHCSCKCTDEMSDMTKRMSLKAKGKSCGSNLVLDIFL